MNYNKLRTQLDTFLANLTADDWRKWKADDERKKAAEQTAELVRRDVHEILKKHSDKK